MYCIHSENFKSLALVGMDKTKVDSGGSPDSGSSIGHEPTLHCVYQVAALFSVEGLRSLFPGSSCCFQAHAYLY